jgi:predicted PurR-regulated permease PerM
MSLTVLLVALLIFVLAGVILSLVGVPYAWAIALVLAILYVLTGFA